MSFENTERIIAILPGDVGAVFPALLSEYGEDLPDGNRTIRTIGAHWDDTAKTRKRAASLTDGTITGQPLTDGRLAFRCLWQSDLVSAYENGQIPEVEELSEEQYQSLLPPPEDQ